MSKLRFRQIEMLAQSHSIRKRGDRILLQLCQVAKPGSGLLDYSVSKQVSLCFLGNYDLLFSFFLILLLSFPHTAPCGAFVALEEHRGPAGLCPQGALVTPQPGSLASTHLALSSKKKIF